MKDNTNNLELENAAESYAHANCRSCNDKKTEEGCACSRLEAAFLAGALYSHPSVDKKNDGHIVDMLFSEGFIDPLKIDEAKKRIPIYPKPSRVPPEDIIKSLRDSNPYNPGGEDDPNFIPYHQEKAWNKCCDKADELLKTIPA